MHKLVVCEDVAQLLIRGREAAQGAQSVQNAQEPVQNHQMGFTEVDDDDLPF